MLTKLPLKHRLAHTGEPFIDDLGFFYKNITTSFGKPTTEPSVYALINEFDYFPLVELVSINDTTLIKMKQLWVIGFDDIKKGSSAYGFAQRLIQVHLDSLINGISILSQLGIVYNDLLQVGYDETNERLLILDFSNALLNIDQKTALQRNLESLTSFLSYYDLGFHAKLISRAYTLLQTVHQWDVERLQSRSYDISAAFSWKVVCALNIDSQVEEIVNFRGTGEGISNVYFCYNSRWIESTENIYQTLLPIDEREIRVVLSDEPLSHSSLVKWDLHNVCSYNSLNCFRDISQSYTER